MLRTSVIWLIQMLSICLLLTSPQQVHSQQESIPELRVEESPLLIGKSFQLPSNVYSAKREINLWLPPSYSEGDKKYPVLYVIDGGQQQDFHHLSGLAQLSTINGEFEELIVVGIKTENRLMELAHAPNDPRYIKDPPNAGKSDEFLKHITDEVFPLIDSKYRTSGRRAVIGESLAGLFVAEVFLKHPGSFTDYISISPSLWWDDRALAKSAGELLAKHDNQQRQLYLTMADEGGTMQSGLDQLIEAIKSNQPTGLEWQYIDRRESEAHSTIYHGASYDALRKLFGIPSPEYGEAPWYLIEGGQPPAEEPSDK